MPLWAGLLRDVNRVEGVDTPGAWHRVAVRQVPAGALENVAIQLCCLTRSLGLGRCDAAGLHWVFWIAAMAGKRAALRLPQAVRRHAYL